MLAKMGFVFDKWARKTIPDPMVFAVLLTFVTFGLGWILTDHGPLEMIQDWNRGFWDLLTFSMQMCLILITGHALATSRAVRRLLQKLAGIPRSQSLAVVLTALVAGLFSLVNWGLGIIVGALFAREIGRVAHQRHYNWHYPLIGAAGYAGFILWHGGLSGSAPLLVATEGHFLQGDIGLIATSDTLFSPLNGIMTLLVLAAVLTTMYLLNPRSPEQIVTIQDVSPELLVEADEKRKPKSEYTPADRLENSRLLAYLLGGMGLVYVMYHFWTHGFALDLNIVNFTFLFLGILLQGSIIRYVRAVDQGVKGCAGIIIQFPLYAGLMGMMKYSGLVAIIAGGFLAISNEVTYPIFTFLSAGLINLFVPSGGGQWAVQGPIMVEAAEVLDVPLGKIVMAVAYGDEWTNMIQPFWALALLGITGLKARQIVGYTMVVMLVTGVVFMLGLLIL